LIDFDIEGVTPSLVMEYIDGPTLADYLEANPNTSTSFVISTARTLFETTSYAHERNIIHRDMKPGNILLQKAVVMIPRIVDFGLAIIDQYDADDHLTAELHPAGTPAYMSPEQFDGTRLDASCDVYAIGVILFEMATASRAFTGRHWSAIALEKRAQPLRVSAVDHFDTPRSLTDLIERCTQPDPKDRPSAAEALALIGGV
jgi:serine/threonine-protein kinase